VSSLSSIPLSDITRLIHGRKTRILRAPLAALVDEVSISEIYVYFLFLLIFIYLFLFSLVFVYLVHFSLNF
jgi:hypothetical protein